MLRTVVVTALLVGTLHHITYGQEPYNYATRWQAWSPNSQAAYVEGLADGIVEAYLTLASVWLPAGEFGRVPPTARVERGRHKLFPWTTISQLAQVVTALYEDPANAYVKTRRVVFIARDRLGGKNVEADLMEARQEAMKKCEMNKSMTLQ